MPQRNEKQNNDSRFPFHPDFKWDTSKQYKTKDGKWNVIPSSSRKEISGQSLIDYYIEEMEKRGWSRETLSGSFHSGILGFEKKGKACHIVFYRGNKEGTSTNRHSEGYKLEIKYSI